MLIKSSKGLYKVEKNYREAFNLEMFQDKYIEECFDKYQYIVGDFSSNILRLKGFDDNPQSNNYYKNIDKYIEDSCAFGSPYFVLSRIHSENEFKALEKNDSDPITVDSRFDITSIQKENFDKESLVLETTPKTSKGIEIDSSKLNAMPKGTLPNDLAEIIKNDKAQANNQRKNNSNPPKEKEPEQTFVSASPDFDPSKKEKKGKFNRRNRK